jgi:hypothetical protein
METLRLFQASFDRHEPVRWMNSAKMRQLTAYWVFFGTIGSIDSGRSSPASELA